MKACNAFSSRLVDKSFKELQLVLARVLALNPIATEPIFCASNVLSRCSHTFLGFESLSRLLNVLFQRHRTNFQNPLTLP